MSTKFQGSMALKAKIVGSIKSYMMNNAPFQNSVTYRVKNNDFQYLTFSFQLPLISKNNLYI